MIDAWTVTALVALGWGLLATIVGLRAFAVRAGFESVKRPVSAERVLLIRPCAGAEQTLERCLVSAAAARRSFALDVVVALSAPDDGAVVTAEAACEILRAEGVSAVVEVHPPTGANRKSALLAGVMASRRQSHAVAISADSNVDLDGFDLDPLVATVEDEATAAAWVPHAEMSSERAWGNRASEGVLCGSLHAFGLLAALDPHGLVGKLFAMRTAAVHDVGGFETLTGYLGEDFELARRLVAAGHAVVPVPAVVPSLAPRRSLGDTVARFARWMTVVRAQRPALLLTYPLFFCGTPLIAALAALCAGGAPILAATALAVAVAGRAVVAAAAMRYSERRVGALDVVVGDVVLLAAWVRALSSRRVTWRSQPLRIERGGLLRAE